MSRIATTSMLAISLLLSRAGCAQHPDHIDPGKTPANTAQDTVDVQHVMNAFHDAVASHDGARLSALFIPEGSTWLNVLTDAAYERAKAKKPDVMKVRISNYKDFAKFISSSQASLEPRHSHVRIHSDSTIASVYFDFVFVINGKDENRGSETWQLAKGTQDWRIAAIAYSSDPQLPRARQAAKEKGQSE
jgi:hypothetical protein